MDDDPDTVAILVRLLRRHERFEVDSAPDVQDAVDVLNSSPPDAVLLDLSLSVMDGHGLLHQVRQTPGTSALPVFVLSGRHEGPAIKAAAQAGASGFIPQPFNGQEIIFKIDQALRGRLTRFAEVADLLQPDEAPLRPEAAAHPRGDTAVGSDGFRR